MKNDTANSKATIPAWQCRFTDRFKNKDNQENLFFSDLWLSFLIFKS